MDIYLVGGAVRDRLLGLAINERDWVVVGSSPEAMVAAGYQAVGKDFPVFLHPETKEEYALARTERKVAKGYQGFTFNTSVDVSLEQDLARRDFTINAIAENMQGQLIDPYHGRNDLENRVLRHVSPAFSEDPVRILRAARFMARLAPLGFTLADDTLALMRDMVRAGEVDALVPERVWQELVKALSAAEPVQFFMVLHACGALLTLFPEFLSVITDALTIKTNTSYSPAINFVIMLLQSHQQFTACEQALTELSKRYPLPKQFQQLAKQAMLYREYSLQHQAQMTAEHVLDLIERLDGFRRSQLFNDCLLVMQQLPKTPLFPPKLVKRAKQIAEKISGKTIMAQGIQGQMIAEKLHAARVNLLEQEVFSKSDASYFL